MVDGRITPFRKILRLIGYLVFVPRLYEGDGTLWYTGTTEVVKYTFAFTLTTFVMGIYLSKTSYISNKKFCVHDT